MIPLTNPQSTIRTERTPFDCLRQNIPMFDRRSFCCLLCRSIMRFVVEARQFIPCSILGSYFPKPLLAGRSISESISSLANIHLSSHRLRFDCPSDELQNVELSSMESLEWRVTTHRWMFSRWEFAPQKRNAWSTPFGVKVPSRCKAISLIESQQRLINSKRCIVPVASALIVDDDNYHLGSVRLWKFPNSPRHFHSDHLALSFLDDKWHSIVFHFREDFGRFRVHLESSRNTIWMIIKT